MSQSSSFPPDFLPRVRQLILPYVTTEDDREALLTDAFYLLSDSRLYHQIKRNGSPQTFTTLLCKTLIDYGCLAEGPHALGQLLQTAKFYCGTDKHADIDALTDHTVHVCAPSEEIAPETEPPSDDPTIRAQLEALQNERLRTQKQFERGDLPQIAYDSMIAQIDTKIAALKAQLIDSPPVPEQAASDSSATVFLSYSHADRAYAESLRAELERAGYAVWIDTSSIKGGDDWVSAISAGIRRSFVVVAVVSRSALASRWARTEILKAINEDKLIVPVLMEDVLREDTYTPLISYQAVRAFELEQPESFRRVLASLPRATLPQPEIEAEPDDENITVTESAPRERTVPRRVELDYLDRLKTEELLNTDRYVSMGGTTQRKRRAEMRAVFKLLTMDEREQSEQRTFENAVEEILAIRRCVLLGEPGGGENDNGLAARG